MRDPEVGGKCDGRSVILVHSGRDRHIVHGQFSVKLTVPQIFLVKMHQITTLGLRGGGQNT